MPTSNFARFTQMARTRQVGSACNRRSHSYVHPLAGGNSFAEESSSFSAELLLQHALELHKSLCQDVSSDLTRRRDEFTTKSTEAGSRIVKTIRIKLQMKEPVSPVRKTSLHQSAKKCLPDCNRSRTRATTSLSVACTAKPNPRMGPKQPAKREGQVSPSRGLRTRVSHAGGTNTYSAKADGYSMFIVKAKEAYAGRTHCEVTKAENKGYLTAHAHPTGTAKNSSRAQRCKTPSSFSDYLPKRAATAMGTRRPAAKAATTTAGKTQTVRRLGPVPRVSP